MNSDGRTLAIGDIHGNLLALNQVLERCNFDYQKDRLITLGDIVDGGPDSKGCVEKLLTILNRVDLLGNHDEWFLQWLTKGTHPANWGQGGQKTKSSYFPGDNVFNIYPGGVPEKHKMFFQDQQLYFEEDNKLFCHAGLPKGFFTAESVEWNCPEELYWTRNMADITRTAAAFKSTAPKKYSYSEIWIGHTQVSDQPLIHEVWEGTKVIMLDTGAGWNGKLTIMDVDTKEYWQSDAKLYPKAMFGR